MKRTITERMVINSTNINNTSNHLSNKLLNKKREGHIMAMEIQVLTWDRHKHIQYEIKFTIIKNKTDMMDEPPH